MKQLKEWGIAFVIATCITIVVRMFVISSYHSSSDYKYYKINSGDRFFGTPVTVKQKKPLFIFWPPNRVGFVDKRA